MPQVVNLNMTKYKLKRIHF